MPPSYGVLSYSGIKLHLWMISISITAYFLLMGKSFQILTLLICRPLVPKILNYPEITQMKRLQKLFIMETGLIPVLKFFCQERNCMPGTILWTSGYNLAQNIRLWKSVYHLLIGETIKPNLQDHIIEMTENRFFNIHEESMESSDQERLLKALGR